MSWVIRFADGVVGTDRGNDLDKASLSPQKLVRPDHVTLILWHIGDVREQIFFEHLNRPGVGLVIVAARVSPETPGVSFFSGWRTFRGAAD
jgi:hypothetical protein